MGGLEDNNNVTRIPPIPLFPPRFLPRSLPVPLLFHPPSSIPVPAASLTLPSPLRTTCNGHFLRSSWSRHTQRVRLQLRTFCCRCPPGWCVFTLHERRSCSCPPDSVLPPCCRTGDRDPQHSSLDSSRMTVACRGARNPPCCLASWSLLPEAGRAQGLWTAFASSLPS